MNTIIDNSNAHKIEKILAEKLKRNKKSGNL